MSEMLEALRLRKPLPAAQEWHPSTPDADAALVSINRAIRMLEEAGVAIALEHVVSHDAKHLLRRAEMALALLHV